MLQPIQAEFGRGIASAMGNATESVKNIGDIARNYLATEERKKTRAEDVAYRDQQAATAKEQFDKSFGLQQAADLRAQAQEGRHVTEFDRKLLGDQRLAEYNQRLSGLLSRGEMGDAQAAKVNAEVERLAAAGVKPEDMAARLGSLAKFSAPKGPRAQAAAIQQAGFESPDYAAEPLLKLQESKAEPFLKQAAADDLYAQQMNMLKLKEAGDNARLAKSLAQKTEKFQPYTVTIGYDSSGKYTSDPTKIAHKSQINVNSPAIESAVAKQYGVKNMQLGSLSDYIPNQRATTGTGKGGGSSDKLFEEVAGTSSYLGGASKYDLSTIADALKADYPKAPKSVIDNLVAKSASKGVTDNPNMDWVKQQLSTYK